MNFWQVPMYLVAAVAIALGLTLIAIQAVLRIGDALATAALRAIESNWLSLFLVGKVEAFEERKLSKK